MSGKIYDWSEQGRFENPLDDWFAEDEPDSPVAEEEPNTDAEQTTESRRRFFARIRPLAPYVLVAGVGIGGAGLGVKLAHDAYQKKQAQAQVEVRHLRQELARFAPCRELPKAKIAREKRIIIKNQHSEPILPVVAAKESDLHVIPDTDVFKSIQSSHGLAGLGKAVDSYTQKLGFNFTIYTSESGNKESGVTPISVADIQYLAEYQGAAVYFVNFLSTIPKELIHTSGLKQVEVVKEFKQRGKTENIAADAGGGKIRISLSDFYSGETSTYRHEIWHLLDSTFCGEHSYLTDDPQYQALNPSNFEYGTSAYIDRGWQDVTVSSYGTSNVGEDKAEVGKGIDGAITPGYLDSSEKVVRQKALLLLARLEFLVPGITKYEALISLPVYQEKR